MIAYLLHAFTQKNKNNMTYSFKNTTSRRALAIGSIMLVIVICGFYIGFMQQFIQYAVDMLYMASRSTTHYLNVVPLQIPR